MLSVHITVVYALAAGPRPTCPKACVAKAHACVSPPHDTLLPRQSPRPAPCQYRAQQSSAVASGTGRWTGRERSTTRARPHVGGCGNHGNTRLALNVIGMTRTECHRHGHRTRGEQDQAADTLLRPGLRDSSAMHCRSRLVARSPWDLHGTPWDLHGTPWDLHGTPWDLHGTPMGSPQRQSTHAVT
jgi:hypothetical protein